MDERFQAFTRVLDPDDNATGGGSASAVAAAMAAALLGMVARVSSGKKNMPESDSFYEECNLQAQALSDELIAGSQADSEAFDRVMHAFRLPRASEADKTARRYAIQIATAGATEVPLQNAELCARVLALADRLAGRSNPNAASDLDCARYLAEAGLKGALSNAEINIESLKDEGLVEGFTARVNSLQRVLSD